LGAAADRTGGVHHAADLRVDQRLGRHAVEVLVVDHHELARQDALDEPLGPQVDPSAPACGFGRRSGRRSRPLGLVPNVGASFVLCRSLGPRDIGRSAFRLVGSP
jgi:hypothetical protein